MRPREFRHLLLGAIALTLAGAAVSAQATPDFSGRWRFTPDPSTAGGGGQGNGAGRGERPPADALRQGGAIGLGPLPSHLDIVQNAKTVTVGETRDGVTAKHSYALNGSAVTNKMAAGRLSGKPATYVSTWTDGRLTTTITIPPAGEVTEETRVTETMYLDSSGALVVETKRPGAPNARRAVYTKVR